MEDIHVYQLELDDRDVFTFYTTPDNRIRSINDKEHPQPRRSMHLWNAQTKDFDRLPAYDTSDRRLITPTLLVQAEELVDCVRHQIPGLLEQYDADNRMHIFFPTRHCIDGTVEFGLCLLDGWTPQRHVELEKAAQSYLNNKTFW